MKNGHFLLITPLLFLVFLTAFTGLTGNYKLHAQEEVAPPAKESALESEPAETEDSNEEKSDEATEEETAEEEALEKLREQRSNTIRYGIDTQVIDLLSQLEEEKNGNFTEELKKLFGKTENEKLQRAILQLFETLDDDGIRTEAHELLETHEELSPSVANALIAYLEDRQNEEITKTFFEMRDTPNTGVATRALRAVGNSGDKEYGKKLLDFTDADSFRDELEPTVLVALGKLKAEEASEYIIAIAVDEDEADSLRWHAAEALGELGGDSSFEALQSLLNDDDAYLRAYVILALGGFDREEAKETLMEALRDDFWRVRVNAADALGKLKAEEALDILEYKAFQDPDIRNVRLAALRAIGSIGTTKAFDLLREIYVKPFAPMILRGEAIKILVEKDLAKSRESIEAVLEKEWDQEKSHILDYTCKLLSVTEDSSLMPLYKRMLSHPRDINIMLYGLRGTRLNKLDSLKGQVEKLTEKGYARGVRQLAQAVLDEL